MLTVHDCAQRMRYCWGMQSKKGKQMLSKIMPFLWQWNNWVDTKAIHIRAWLTAELDGDWDESLDGDVIEKMWKEKHD